MIKCSASSVDNFPLEILELICHALRCGDCSEMPRILTNPKHHRREADFLHDQFSTVYSASAVTTWAQLERRFFYRQKSEIRNETLLVWER